MKRFLTVFLILLLSLTLTAEKRILRLSPEEFSKAGSVLKGIDIAGANINDYYDIVADDDDMYSLMQAGIEFKFGTMPDAKATFIDLDSVYSWLEGLHAMYPAITDIDTIGFTTSDNNPLVLIKINGSDPVNQGSHEAFLLMGNHHAREWQTVYVPLFYADSILAAYGSDPSITALIDSVFIVVLPIVNPDGYDYSRNYDNMWRKNRSYRDGQYGVDINRNYNGSYNFDYEADWGFIGNDYTTHNPTDDIYCGPYAGSETEVKLVQELIKTYDFSLSLSLHSYGEMLMWPWGAVTYAAPDSTQLIHIGTEAASLMRKQDGYSQYDAHQSCGLYPVTGDSEDWIYGYSKYVLGNTVYSYISEIDVSFNSNEADLDSLCRRIFPGILYLNHSCESISVSDAPLKPELSFSNDTLYWTGTNMNTAEYFTIYNYSSPSITEDSLCDSMLFDVNGFETAIATTETGGISWHSQNLEFSTRVLQFKNKVLVNPGDSLRFRFMCDLEQDYDKAFVEASLDGCEWKVLDSLDGSFTGFIPYTDKAYSLADYEGSEIYVRFRVSFDGNTFGSGFYLDDISPIQSFITDSVFMTGISDTFTDFNMTPYLGEYFAVRPYQGSIYTQISDRTLCLSTALENGFLSGMAGNGYVRLIFTSTHTGVFFRIYRKHSDYRMIGETDKPYFIDNDAMPGINKYKVEIINNNGQVLEYNTLSINMPVSGSILSGLPDIYMSPSQAMKSIINIDSILIYDKSGRKITDIRSSGLFFIKMEDSELIKRITVL